MQVENKKKKLTNAFPMEWVLGLVEGLYSFVHLLMLTSSQKLKKRLMVSYVAKFESSDRLKRVAKLFYRRLFGGGQVGAPTWSEGTGSIFAEYVLLASHNPYLIIVSFVANYI